MESMPKSLEENCSALRSLDITEVWSQDFVSAVLQKTRGRVVELDINTINVAAGCN